MPAFAAPLIDVTPYNPSPNDILRCEYKAFQEGDILRFIWYRNGRDIADVGDKRINFDFLEPGRVGGLFKLDEINCDVHRLNQVNQYELVDNDRELDGLVTVGEYECNDGLDNDGDHKFDLQDPECDDRTDNLEQEHPRLLIQRFCNEHPNNFLCLQMGYSDIISLCSEFSTSSFCVEEEVNIQAYQNSCNLDNVLCNGIENIASYCGDIFDNGNDAFICNTLSLITNSCEEENRCFELNDNDKANLCKVNENYEFCNNFPARLGERCNNRDCDDGLVCNDNNICEDAFCDEGDIKIIECRNGIEIEQECEDNDWIGECPRNAECQSGKTKKIICSDGSELTQTCKNYNWIGECPEIQQTPKLPQRSQNQLKPEQTTPQKVKEPEPAQDSKSQWPLIVLILVLAIVLAALAFYLPSKKQKSKKR